MARMEIVTSGGGSPGAPPIGEAAAAALTEAGLFLAGNLKAAVPVDTGQLAESIKPTAVKGSGNGMYIDVYPQGTRKKTGRQKKGVRNAMVGFIHEHGTSRIPAKHWMSNTVDDTQAEVEKIIEEGVASAVEAALLEAVNI